MSFSGGFSGGGRRQFAASTMKQDQSPVPRERRWRTATRIARFWWWFCRSPGSCCRSARAPNWWPRYAW